MTSSGAGHPDGRTPHGHAPQDTGTPIYEELVRQWRAAGREVPEAHKELTARRPAEPQDYFGRG
ncbi:hypothetical protein RKD23_000661 [Streptomyces sp. SAI-170]